MIIVLITLFVTILVNRTVLGQPTCPSEDDSADPQNECTTSDSTYRMEQKVEQLQLTVDKLTMSVKQLQGQNMANNQGNPTCPSNCSFPFTYNQQLYYQCTPGSNGYPGCYIQGRIWKLCEQSSNCMAQNTTVNITVPTFSNVLFTVTSVNNWIVFQQRIDDSVNFNRSWSEYKTGFGIYNGNFWMGLEKIYQLTNSANYRLRFEWQARNGTWRSVEYDSFRISSESSNYVIRVTGHSGDIEDIMNGGGLHQQNGMAFSTYDRDNDGYPGNCANEFGGGGWFNGCCLVCVNSLYKPAWFLIYDGNSWIDLSTSRMMMKLT